MRKLFGDSEFDKPFHFITLPNTGLQICRGFPLQHVSDDAYQWVWGAACQLGQRDKDTENVKLLTESLAVDQIDIENASGWIVVDDQNMIHFRLTRASEGAIPKMDIVIDTRSEAGRACGQVIDLIAGRLLAEKVVGKIVVENPDRAAGVRGELIIDYGNSGITAVWFPVGEGAGQEKLLKINEPYDRSWRQRADTDRTIPSSCIAAIKVLGNELIDPWIIMGKQAEEFLKNHPNCTYQFAPKKYVRFWPEHLKSLEPTTAIRGKVGVRQGLHPALKVVGMGVRNLLSNILASIINPNYAATEPAVYPKIDSVMLTYPLTWRENDRAVFKDLFQEAAKEFLHGGAGGLEGKGSSVELICSEPVAVAAYFIWESIFYYRLEALDFMAGAWGKSAHEPALRMLVLDIGGGSTDIAVVESSWQPRDDGTVDVRFKMIENMCFNRAGDRLTHLILTALRDYICKKHELPKNLAFDQADNDPNFSPENKRHVVSCLSDLAEKAKRYLSKAENAKPFPLEPGDEMSILNAYGPVAAHLVNEAAVSQGSTFTLSREMLKKWVEQDRQRRENNGQTGFMDIFNFLEDLGEALKERGQFPHVAVLSGRSTRLPLIKELVVEKLDMPAHRVRTLEQLLPLTVQRPGHENPDKISVVIGGNRFRSAGNTRFIPVPEEKIFKRFIGVVGMEPEGRFLNRLQIKARPGEDSPRTVVVTVPPQGNVELGHSFRETSTAHVMAVLSNATDEEKTVTVDLVDDHEIRLHELPGVSLREWVPGGDDLIMDNFKDTGEIDNEPPDFIERHVIQ
jgi:hypothetical protein